MQICAIDNGKLLIAIERRRQNRRKGKRQRSNQSVAVYFKIFLDCLPRDPADDSLHTRILNLVFFLEL